MANTEPHPQLHDESLPGPAPCDDCRFRERCGREHLACDSFALYLHGKSDERWQIAPRAPTRAIYLALRLNEAA